MNAGLGVDYDDGAMRKRWFVTWYSAGETWWFRVFGFGFYRGAVMPNKFLFP